MDVKFIANFELIDIGKKSGTRQASVCRQHCMIAFSSNRKLRTVQMSDSGLEYIIAGSMINCKFDIDLPRFQDWDFAIQILKSGFSVYYIAEPLVECFVLNDSITSNGEKGKKALCIFDKKYKNDYIRNKESGKEFYFRAAVMMEKMGYNGKKYFRKAYAAEKGLGMYIRYLMSAIRIYRPINKIFDRIINGI